MKKLIAILMTLAMVLALAACGSQTPAATDSTGNTSAEAGKTEVETTAADGIASESIIYLCINLGDLSFNDLGWKGCQDAAAKYGWSADVIELGKDTSVYENAFLDAIDSGKYTIVVTQSN